MADNVFPDVDVLNIEPLRHLIHEVFNRHIIHAPGMAKFGELTHWGILPTPGAVLRGAELFAEELGDCLVFERGWSDNGCPLASPTVQRNGPPRNGGARTQGQTHGGRRSRCICKRPQYRGPSGQSGMEARLAELQALPSTERERELTRALCAFAVETGAKRHAVSSPISTPPRAESRS